MARPLRRVLIGLAIRLGFDVDVIERWDMEKVREYIVTLSAQNRPTSREQTPEDVERGLIAAYGRPNN